MLNKIAQCFVCLSSCSGLVMQWLQLGDVFVLVSCLALLCATYPA